MTALAIDTENNTWNKGAPFDRRFKNVCFSWASDVDAGADKTDEDAIERLRSRIERASILVGFNLKYDIHVLRKLGIDVSDKRVWCCQLAEFIRSNQTWKYPSLDESAARYGLGKKIDVVAEEYWSKGIQTEDIPWNILAEYAEQDAILTLKLYEEQMRIMSSAQKRLCRLQCMDLMILEEMEWNGLKYDEQLCEERAEDIKNKIRDIEVELSGIYPDVPINFASGDQLSCFLYGGPIVETRKKHIGFFKSGAKIGQPRYQNEEVIHELPRLVDPLPRSELLKKGFYATNADTLLKLKAGRKTKHIIEKIQQATRYSTLLSKTYEGIRKANRENNWEPGWLHGQFNQVTVSTGRLSSSQPKQYWAV